jgi:hypothetical protein
MERIPTVEEFFKDYSILCHFEEGDPEYLVDKECFNEAMERFAKLHVKAALEAALDSIPCLGSSTDIASYEEVEKEVLNAYPEENIR